MLNKKETYKKDGFNWYVAADTDISKIKTELEISFDNPEAIFEECLFAFIQFGDNILETCFEHLKTLTDEDMPENYHNDLIDEINSRVKRKLQEMKAKRFRIIKTDDPVSKQFNAELENRKDMMNMDSESYEIAEEGLRGLGYKTAEIKQVLKEAITVVKDANDAQQLFIQALRIINGDN